MIQTYQYRDKKFMYAPEIVKELRDMDIDVFQSVRDKIDGLIEQGAHFTKVSVVVHRTEEATEIEVKPE